MSAAMVMVAAAVWVAVPYGQQPPQPQAQQPQGPDMNAYYQIGPDSQSHEGVPKGDVRGPFTLPSQAYPGTQHTYWVYVPAQYDPARSRQPHDFSGWPGVQGHGRRACARRTCSTI